MSMLFLMKGLPGSGKSTMARELRKNLGNVKIVNKDRLREMLDDSQYSEPNERFVLQVRDMIVTHALRNGLHVIVDDTNLDPIHEETLRGLARRENATFSVMDNTHISVEECIANDLKRTSGQVGEVVIRNMYEKYLAPNDDQQKPFKYDVY